MAVILFLLLFLSFQATAAASMFVVFFLCIIVRDSYRILGLGGDSTPRGSGGMFPQEFFLKTNALRLILGHFLVHMHILANTLHSSKRLCILL